jgi:ATP-binding cassette subfamily B protein
MVTGNSVGQTVELGVSIVAPQKLQVSTFTLFKRLWSHMSLRRRGQTGLLLVLMLVTALAEVVSIGAVLPFLGVLTSPDVVFKQPMLAPFITALGIETPAQLLLPLTIAFALAAVLSGAMRIVLIWAQYRLSSVIGTDLSLIVYRRTLFQPYAVHVARNSSDLISAISGKVGSVTNSLLNAQILVSSFFLMAMILGVLLLIDPLIAVTAFVGFGLVYVLVIMLTKKRLQRDSKLISQQSNKVVKALQEGLGGIRDVLIDGTQNTYCDIYRTADQSLRRAQANVNIVSSSPRFMIEALGMVLIAGLAFVMAQRSEGLSGAIPVLGALALGAQRLLPVLQQAYSSFSSIRGNQRNLEDVIDLLDQPMPDQPVGVVQPISFTQGIQINQLSFQYAEQSPWVLKGVNLSIEKGSRVGFIGSTGSGKSTLIDLVMSLLQPTQGTLEIDGQAITLANQRAWQALLAHVPQSIFLADSSIAENIAFGVPRALIDMQRVQRAAQQAQIAQTIEGWEKGYETFVGERGVRLSGGQRQRIGIARALYKQANVIVFDEATSALDNETERAVMQAIDDLGDELTVLIVAHRLSTLKHCTKIVELKQGQVLREGRYEDIVGDLVH